MEAIFKALAKSLDQATMLDKRLSGESVVHEGDAVRQRQL